MKRFFAIICAVLMMISAFAAASEEPMPQDTPIKSDGIDMLAVDHRLYELGYRDAECNGELDEVTINALRKFQTVNGLKVTGDADEQTVRLLLSEKAISQIEYLSQRAYEYANMAPLKNGSYGDQVMKLQRALQKQGYFSGNCDGAYGDATAAAVRRFQLANGLVENGIADGAVFLRLYEGQAIGWQEFIEKNCAAVGDSGDHVRLIQILLRNRGYFSGECTGRYGEGTQNAVREFQLENSIEASGDVDSDTIRLLLMNMNTAVSSPGIFSRGSTGEKIDAMCARLSELGYGAHATFDMQTELALMKYHLANGMQVSGSAEESLLEHISGESALPMEAYEYIVPVVDAEGYNKIARKAVSMLGQMTQFDDQWNFVEYLLLYCGYPLPDAGKIDFSDIEVDSDAQAGSILHISLNDQEIYGIASTDGAVIYQGEEGYIIISYLDMLEADRVSVAGLEAEDA
ncbi:MAG: peptidoglycan-binding protein [Clostridia bacterium]|nr:peptidoglycan-binding protein [Clostridia bacterium]